jgi:hypothetical protein
LPDIPTPTDTPYTMAEQSGPIFVPPSNQRVLVTFFSILDISAWVGLLIILALGARTKRLRSNLVLLNFEFVIFLTALGQSLLIWTGNAYNMDPPRGLCVASGAFITSTSVFKAGAAFGLTCKV